MRLILPVLFALAIGLWTMPKSTTADQLPSVDRDKIAIITVYDNYPVNPKLATAWGFAAIVITPGVNLLFDTGGDGAMLLSNMKALGFNPNEIDEVVISHVHADHLGGLSTFLGVNPNVRVWIPSSFPESVRQAIVRAGARYEAVTGPVRIVDGIYTTGEMGGAIKEQSLIVETAEGLVVITGCAHPGIVNVVRAAKNLLPDRPVAFVMGGFHLLRASTGELDAVIEAFRRMGVKEVAPSHCSGDRTRSRFRKEYKDRYIEGGAGRALIWQQPS